jgi:hypothetical protein
MIVTIVTALFVKCFRGAQGPGRVVAMIITIIILIISALSVQCFRGAQGLG